MSWLIESNRKKHLLYAIPIGFIFTILGALGCAFGMEFKDKQYGGHQTAKYFQDKSHLDTINSFINEPDDVILGMPEQDRKMFTQEGVDSLYQKYRTDPYWKDYDDQAINRHIFYDLTTLYNKYALKEDEKH